MLVVYEIRLLDVSKLPRRAPLSPKVPFQPERRAAKASLGAISRRRLGNRIV